MATEIDLDAPYKVEGDDDPREKNQGTYPQDANVDPTLNFVPMRRKLELPIVPFSRMGKSTGVDLDN